VAKGLRLIAIVLGVTRPLSAQHEHATGERVGRVSFAVSCRAAVRPDFEQAVAYLHSFWYEKATAAFRDVVARDSTCAMGYWGQAMSLWHPLWTPPSPAELSAGLAAAERGVALARTPRERDYLDAVATFYRDAGRLDNGARLTAYVQKIEAVARRYPADTEASIFYALGLIALGQAHPTDTTFTYQRRADSILEPVFARRPAHPGLAHYLIHANDAPRLATHGLNAARHYAAIAPDVPHAQHMPSHLFVRLGLWDDAIASNLRSAASGRAFERAQHMTALWDQTGHAWDYLMYAYLQQGKDSAARAIVAEAAGVTDGFPAGSLINEYALAAIPARYALERGRWDEAARLEVRPAPEWRAAEAITHFARALGVARGRPDSAALAAELAALTGIERDLRQAGGPQTYWADQVKIQILAAGAWNTLVIGHDTAAALEQAKAAADIEDVTQKHPVTPGPVLPARELYGDMLLAVGRSDEAAAAYGEVLRNGPGRRRSLDGLHRARHGGAATFCLQVDTARREMVLTAGPFRVPAGDVPGDMATAMAGGFLVRQFPWPMRTALRGFRLELLDDRGRPLPRRLVHHLYLLDFGRRELLYPMVQRFLGVGRETPDVSLPRTIAVPLDSGTSVGWFLMWGNETGGEVPDVHVRLRLFWTAADQQPPPIPVEPFFADVHPVFGTDFTFAIPPGGDSVAREFTPPISGHLVVAGGHLHDHGVALRLEDAVGGRVLATFTAHRDSAGRVVSVSRRAFGTRGNGLGLRPDHRYRLVAIYQNPTRDTLTGLMGTMGALFAPDRLSAWPPVPRGDHDYQLDSSRMSVAPPDGPVVAGVGGQCAPEPLTRGTPPGTS
jgi:tetratricopeptide (TPR) repeat protein